MSQETRIYEEDRKVREFRDSQLPKRLRVGDVPALVTMNRNKGLSNTH